MRKPLRHAVGAFLLSAALGVLWAWPASPEGPPALEGDHIEQAVRELRVATAPGILPGASTRAAGSDEPGERPEGSRGPVPPQLPPDFHPRPPGEWQGMLIDRNAAPTCNRTENCSRGQVCKKGIYRCLPCESDSECLVREVCVLDHCVPLDDVQCRTAADCDGELCILDGSGKQATRDDVDTLAALCSTSEGSEPPVEEKSPDALVDPRPPPVLHALMDEIDQDFVDDPEDADAQRADDGHHGANDDPHP